jgi:hypothetical protein
MATIDAIIACFPKFLKDQPRALSDDRLDHLEQVLASLDQTTTLRDGMTVWFKALVVQKTAEPIEKAWFTQDSSSIKSKIERGNF